jgi:hypothetical protein
MSNPDIKTVLTGPIGGYCKSCNGSGEGVGLEGGGPDAYEVPINCPACQGTGERRVLTDEQIEDMFFGEIDNRTLSFARAIEAAVLSALAEKDADAVLAFLNSDEAAAHIYPSELDRFKENECHGVAYSIAVGCPEERSVPLFTIEQIRAALQSAGDGDKTA